MATTPIYGLPYQGLTDAPHGPNLGANLAIATEAELARIDAATTALAARVVPLEGTWISYTPTWVSLTGGTAPVLANHARTGRYIRINSHLVLVQVKIVFGGAGYGTGVYGIGLPFNASLASVGYSAGAGHALNNALAEYSVTCTLYDVTQLRLFHNSASVTESYPFAFGNTDVLWGSILIEPA